MNRTKLLLSNLALALLLVGSFGGVAQAHELERDNGMSGVLHVPPDDNPVAGQTTKLYVSFANKPATFALAHCICTFSVGQNGKLTQTAKPEPALPGATLQGAAPFEFPKIGVYNFVASGASDDGSFAPFNIKYTIRITRGIGTAAPVAAKTASNNAPLVIGGGIFAVVAFMAYATIGGGGRYAAKPDAVVPVKPVQSTNKKRSK